MFTIVQTVGQIAFHLKYLLPKTSKKIENIFNVDTEYNYKNGCKIGTSVEFIPSGTKINPSEILFPKIEDEQVAFQIEKLNKSKPQSHAELVSASNNENLKQSRNKSGQVNVAVKPEITYDDFSKLDIRTGKILAAEKVAKADKLLKLLVDVGFEERTIVSGIAEHFSPEEIIGKEVSVLVNLAPRKLKGIESNGMILMAEDANGKLYFVNADGVATGNIIK